MSRLIKKIQTNPNYNELTEIVSIPIMEENHMIMTNDIHSAEERYIALRDNATDIEEKIKYDRARAVCKWAATCGASIKYERVENRRLYFKFGFSSLEQLEIFHQNANNNIIGSTMTDEYLEQMFETPNKTECNIVTNPDYTNFTTTVTIPFIKIDQMIISKDINNTEKRYIALRDNTTNQQEKIYYDRARTVCKWAATCGAKIITQHAQNGQLQFKFGFSSLEQLKDFENSAITNIEGATMKEESTEKIVGVTGTRR